MVTKDNNKLFQTMFKGYMLKGWSAKAQIHIEIKKHFSEKMLAFWLFKEALLQAVCPDKKLFSQGCGFLEGDLASSWSFLQKTLP